MQDPPEVKQITFLTVWINKKTFRVDRKLFSVLVLYKTKLAAYNYPVLVHLSNIKTSSLCLGFLMVTFFCV